MNLLSLIPLILASLPEWPSAQAADAGRAAFQREWTQVRQRMSEGKWALAQEQLLDLLHEHREQEYVMGRRPEIHEDLIRCAVRMAVREPDPGDLVEGHFLYNRRSGEVNLTCNADELRDFEKLDGGVHLHPVSFNGPYTVEVTGSSFPSKHTNPSVLVAVRDDEAYQIMLGYVLASGTAIFETPPQVFRVLGSRLEEVQTAITSPIQSGEPFDVRVVVSDTHITVSFNERPLLRVEKPAGLWGQVGFLGFDQDDNAFQIEISGRANTSWVEGIISETTREAEQQFLATLDRRTVIPPWLELRPNYSTPLRANRTTKMEKLPWQFTKEQEPIVNQLLRRITSGDVARIRECLETQESKLPAGLREFAWALTYWYDDQPFHAIQLFEGVLAQHPEFQLAHYGMASALLEVGSYADAFAAFEKFSQQSPRNAGAYAGLCCAAMNMWQHDRARQVLLEARQRKLQSPDLERLDGILARAERGPNFSRVFTHETDNYVITSNLDRRICIDVGTTLEDASRQFSDEFGEVRRREKSRVYVFRGQAEYESYASSVLADQHPSGTAGLYSRLVKQLLVWNSPDRQQMLRTVRHEALHQYFDLQGIEVPIWLEEGIAEYYAHVESSHADDQLDRVLVGTHVRQLQAELDQLPTLTDVLKMSRASFYENARWSYSWAWAFAHFLQEEAQHPNVFADLLDDARNRTGIRKVISKILREQDLVQLDTLFRDYVRSFNPDS